MTMNNIPNYIAKSIIGVETYIDTLHVKLRKDETLSDSDLQMLKSTCLKVRKEKIYSYYGQAFTGEGHDADIGPPHFRLSAGRTQRHTLN